MPGDQIAVARNNFHLHTVAPQFLQHLSGIRDGRIRKREKPGQRQIPLVCSRVCRTLFNTSVGDRENRNPWALASS